MLIYSVIIILVLLLILAVMYNNLVKLRSWVRESWAQISVQLKRRNDLIPNLVSTVKGYAQHEQELFDKVLAARTKLVNAGSENKSEIIRASDQLSQSLRTVFALSEAYPDLKASVNFQSLQEELANTENKIAYARQLYNTSVNSYNVAIKTIPNNIIAGLFGFSEEAYLEVSEAEKAVPKVSF